jgi:hypothetical protein
MKRILAGKLKIRARCEIRGCKNAASFFIGLEGFRPMHTHLCDECFRTIVGQGKDLLDKIDDRPEETPGSEGPDIRGPGMDAGGPPSFASLTGLGTMTGLGSLTGTSEPGSDAVESAGETPAADGPATEGDADRADAPESDGEAPVYECKYCGTTFPKPEGLGEYRTHILRCASETKGKAGE